MPEEIAGRRYRGRLAPTPTGCMHLGHARTFLTAQSRAEAAQGILILRVEDLDRDRCKPEFIASLAEDLNWAGLRWSEGPDVSGSFGPYSQSERLPQYIEALQVLRRRNLIFPCDCSRKDVQLAAVAPHEEGGEPLYPGTCRSKADSFSGEEDILGVNWRFRVPDGTPIAFHDKNLGPRTFVAGKEFGDFLVWRKDGIPSYELAVVVDDAAMAITEVVRGEDLLMSTARQILLYQALDFDIPDFYHCPLVRDSSGRRLAKRDKDLSLREMRQRGVDPAILRSEKFMDLIA